MHGGPHLLEVRNCAEKNLNATGYKVRFKQLLTNKIYDLQTWLYSYDALERVMTANACPGTNATATPLRAYAYGFDVAGNRTSQSVALNGGAPTVTTYTHDAANRITSGSVTYNAAGRMTNDGTNTYVSDRADRLLSMGGGAYQYNGLSQRVQQTVGTDVTKYLLDVQPGLFQVLAETENGQTTRHIFDPLAGLQQIQQPSGAWQYPIRDGLSSVKAVTDANGMILHSSLYDPFGDPIATTGNPQTAYGFTSEPTTGTGLVYLRARYYAPWLGVFPSLDPVEDGNRYAWVGGNVVNRVDPSGRCSQQGRAYAQGAVLTAEQVLGVDIYVEDTIADIACVFEDTGQIALEFARTYGDEITFTALSATELTAYAAIAEEGIAMVLAAPAVLAASTVGLIGLILYVSSLAPAKAYGPNEIKSMLNRYPPKAQQPRLEATTTPTSVQQNTQDHPTVEDSQKYRYPNQECQDNNQNHPDIIYRRGQNRAKTVRLYRSTDFESGLSFNANQPAEFIKYSATRLRASGYTVRYDKFGDHVKNIFSGQVLSDEAGIPRVFNTEDHVSVYHNDQEY